MLFVYTTTSTIMEAKTIATHIIEQRLAAGVNIIPQVHSIYHWQGNIVQSEECICIFKSTQENFDTLKKAILLLHSYETPCIVALPIADIEERFGAWIKQESRIS